jgi:hypothetical protein
VVFAFLGQAGTTVKGAYDVLVSMSVITYFIPFLYLFASMFKLQREPAGLGVIQVPGGKPVALLMASVGFSTTLLTIVLSLIPAADEPNKILAVVKIVGLTGLVIVVGALLYWLGKRKCGPGSWLGRRKCGPGSSSVNAAIGTGVPPGVH